MGILRSVVVGGSRCVAVAAILVPLWGSGALGAGCCEDGPGGLGCADGVASSSVCYLTNTYNPSFNEGRTCGELGCDGTTNNGTTIEGTGCCICSNNPGCDPVPHCIDDPNRVTDGNNCDAACGGAGCALAWNNSPATCANGCAGWNAVAPAPAMSWSGLAIAMAVLGVGAFVQLRRRA